jgi:hypothetical protein
MIVHFVVSLDARFNNLIAYAQQCASLPASQSRWRSFRDPREPRRPAGGGDASIVASRTDTDGPPRGTLTPPRRLGEHPQRPYLPLLPA